MAAFYEFIDFVYISAFDAAQRVSLRARISIAKPNRFGFILNPSNQKIFAADLAQRLFLAVEYYGGSKRAVLN